MGHIFVIVVLLLLRELREARGARYELRLGGGVVTRDFLATKRFDFEPRISLLRRRCRLRSVNHRRNLLEEYTSG
jgi:hypothetical protein